MKLTQQQVKNPFFTAPMSKKPLIYCTPMSKKPLFYPDKIDHGIVAIPCKQEQSRSKKQLKVRHTLTTWFLVFSMLCPLP